MRVQGGYRGDTVRVHWGTVRVHWGTVRVQSGYSGIRREEEGRRIHLGYREDTVVIQ